MRLIARIPLLGCLWVAICLLCAATAHARSPLPAWPGTAQAARSDWSATTPPRSGWVDVSLPDDWSSRWPDFDGVVWYRLTWTAHEPNQEVGLYIDHLSLAGVVAVNGHELLRDESLVEPLSRMWNTPRYLLLPAPLLREGENEILMRVSGSIYYQPALGRVAIGAPEEMRALRNWGRWLRIEMQWLTLGIGTTLGTFFFALWLIRRSETAFGWYAAQQAAWLVFSLNLVWTSTWPFHDSDTYSALVSSSYVIYDACNAMFVVRFMGRRWPRAEAAMWLIVAVAAAAMFLTPHEYVGEMRNALAWLSMSMIAITTTVFLYLAWHHGNVPQRVLSLIALAVFFVRAHDFLVFFKVIVSSLYLVTYAETLSMVGFALTLAWIFAANIRRIESFNQELSRTVAHARTELAATLERQHELEIVHARLDERLTLAHDLHDGLGGMLIGNIATLEEAPETIPTRTVLDLLRELRDDLRLIIDTASSQTYGEDSLGELVALLRHRMTRLFEARRIAIHWHISGIDKLRLTSGQSMDILRILQEALSNVLKHSGATGAEIDLAHVDHYLRLEVRDNGVGLPEGSAKPGTGIRSMRIRARRLNARLSVDASEGTTLIRLDMPLPVAAQAAKTSERQLETVT